MPMDVGMTPPPPSDVGAMMKSGPSDLGGMFGSMQGAQSMQSTLEASAQIQAVAPLILEIARMVPALAPDAAGLAQRLSARLQGQQLPPGQGGQPAGPLSPQIATPGQGAAQPAPVPPPGLIPPGAEPLPPEAAAAGAPGPVPPPMGIQSAGVGFAPAPPMGPAAPMPVSTTGGLMGLVQQAEMILPAIASADPSVAPDIQFFVARMREEVPKILQGESPSLTPPPTDEMMKAMPVTV